MKRFLVVGLCVAVLGSFSGNPARAAEMPVGETEVASTGLPAKTVTASVGDTHVGLQALLDENAEGEYQLTVKIPAGTYELDRSLYVYPNTTIEATGAKLVKLRNYGAMIEAKLSADDGGYDANHDITINGGTWDSYPVQKETSGTETFRFIHCNNITIKNATLCNVPDGSHLIVFAGVKDAKVTDCEFYGYGADWRTAEKPKEAIQLDMVHSIDEVPTLQDGEILNWDDLPCDNIEITGCKFHDFSRGIGSHTAVKGRFHTNVTISDNKFDDLADSAIRLFSYKDTVVSNNTITNAAIGVLAYTYIESSDEKAYLDPIDGKVGTMPNDYNITIQGNTIDKMKLMNGTWGDGIRVLGDAQDNRLLYGVKITGNKISNTERYGIFATGAPALTISGKNEISTTTSDGILLTAGCDDSKIYSNTVKNASGSGIAVYDSKQVSVYSNTVTSPKASGIYLIQSESCLIGTSASTGNKITGAGEFGIYLTTRENQTTGCTSTTVQYNTVTNAGTEGIGVHGSSKVTVQNNTITAKKNGIYVRNSSTYAKIDSNTITSAGETGIWVSNGSNYATVTNNTIEKYGTTKSGDGIYIYQSGGDKSNPTLVEKNSITGIGQGKGLGGIRIGESAYTTATKNTIKTPAGAGIYVQKSKNCTIGSSSTSYNTIKTTTTQGIYLTNECDSGSVLYNKISGVKTDGIGVYSSKKVTVKGNSISASGHGINVNTNSQSVKIESNTIKSAGKTGIWVASGSKYAQVTGNTIEKYAAKAKGDGIYIYQSGGSKSNPVLVQKNNITGTGTGTGKNGIRISDAAYTTVTENTIKNAPGVGIYVYKSANCTIGSSSKSYNTIKSPTAQGIYLTTKCNSGKVLYNKLSGVKTDGIGVYSSTKVTVKGNTIAAKGHGINVNTKSQSAKIVSNTITSAGKSGIWLATNSTLSTIDGNTIKKYGSSGTFSAIYVFKSGGTSAKKQTKVTNNTITGTNKRKKNPGIKVSDSANTLLESNTITSAQGTGIYVLKSKKCVINNNTVTSAKERGIYVTTACNGAQITSNTVKKAAGASISIYGAPNSVISNNKVTGKSSQRGIWVSKSNKTQIKSNTVTGAKKKQEILVTSSTGCKKSKNKVK